MRLRYTGTQRVTFVGVGELEPGDEFEVPDEEAARWLCRADVVEDHEQDQDEPADDRAPAKPRRLRKAPATDHTDTAAAAPEEDSGDDRS